MIQLDVVRGIAILAVMAYHFRTVAVQNPITQGFDFVSYGTWPQKLSFNHTVYEKFQRLLEDAMNLDLLPLTQTSSYTELYELQRDAILAQGRCRKCPLSILEAGCGQRWKIDLTGVEYVLTGVDLDSAALDLRKNKAQDLDVAIVGDLCSVEIPEASFDVVVSSFVLEHVQRADVALQKMVTWLKPGGLLILNLPEREAVRSFFTRAIPHRGHVWYYRYILRNKQAGRPGFNPYPTYHHPVIGREQLCGFLAERGVQCVARYGDGFRRDGKGMTRIMLRGIVKLTAFLSFGKLTADYCDILYIAVKDAPGTQSLN